MTCTNLWTTYVLNEIWIFKRGRRGSGTLPWVVGTVTLLITVSVIVGGVVLVPVKGRRTPIFWVISTLRVILSPSTRFIYTTRIVGSCDTLVWTVVSHLGFVSTELSLWWIVIITSTTSLIGTRIRNTVITITFLLQSIVITWLTSQFPLSSEPMTGSLFSFTLFEVSL